MNYFRGSEWRKWDLHVHAPSEYTLIKKDDYEGNSGEDKMDKFIWELKSLSDISVLWITDYFSIEWYKEVKNYKNELSNINLIIPNLELRITPETKDWNKINLHVLFNTENLSEDKIEHFLYSFIYPQQGHNFTCKRDDLIELWRTFKKTASDKEALKIWLNTFSITYQNFFDTIEKQDIYFKNNILIWVSNNSEDWASGIRDLPWIRNVIYRWVNFVFSSQESDRLYFLWKWSDNEEVVIEKYWALKPCIHGSDYHWNKRWRNICVPDLNRFCRIKADPTFEWLKQILYEPEDRVKIQEELPENKESYVVIDKVNFSDNNFSPDDIYISKNLTAIIWWKSTWKSILLREIAETIDKQEVEKRLSEASLSQYGMNINKFNVVWNDWQTSNDNVEKKIIYIPQSYLNRITEDWESENAIVDIIVNVLKNEADINKAFDSLDYQKRQISQLLNKNIEDLFYSIETWWKCAEKIKNIWDKKWIEKEVGMLKIKIEELKKTINLKQEELEKYNILMKDILEINNKKLVLLQTIDVYDKLLKFDKYFTFDPQIFNCLSECPKEYQNDLNEMFYNYKDLFTQWLKMSLQEKLNDLKKECHDLDEKNEKLKIEIAPLDEKIKKSEVLNQSIARLREEEIKLAKINMEEKLKEELKNKNNEFISEIIKNISSYYTLLMNIKDDILKQKTITENNGLNFSIDVKFDFNKFQENFEKIVFDQRKTLSDDFKFEKDITYESFQRKLDIIIRAVLKGDVLPIRPQFTPKEVITKLAQSWFFFNYKISEDGDELSQMSPWKKSYVLLKLLIELDSSKCPILLDQPEDDLDNRSIYQDLARFIKEKKKYRQFIIATHNPNLIVGTDAECIIVANQWWKKSKNRNYKFEYVQWALENTKQLDDQEECVLYRQWIQEHICEILEWWREAFEQRKNKYWLK